jgi:hypothetical protein
MPELLRLLYDLQQVLAKDELGRVVHRGAGPKRYEWWVQSDERQTSTHKRTGWHTDATAVAEFEDEAAKKLDEALQGVIDGRARDALRGFAKDLLADILAYMQDYPSPPPQSTYERTYLLHDRWDTELSI